MLGTTLHSWYGPNPAKSSLGVQGAVAKGGLIWGRTAALFCTFMVLHRSIKPMFPLSSRVSAQIPTSAQK